jgi:hypothetical protein
MAGGLQGQIHRDLYEALRLFESWDGEASGVPLVVVAQLVRGIVILLDVALLEATEDPPARTEDR